MRWFVFSLALGSCLTAVLPVSGQDLASIACGQDGIAGELDTLAEVDMFTFDGQAGDVVAITLGEETQDDANFGPWFRLVAPSETVLGSTFGQATFTLAETGTHLIEVFDF